MKSKKIFSAVSGLIVLSLLSSGCGKKKEAAEDEEAEMGQVLANGNAKNPTTTGSVPQVGSINLGGLGDESSAAALNMTEESDETKCSDGPDMGIFGLALGGACHTTGLASKLMLGSESGDNNKDGKVDCGDYTEGKDNGIMLGLMCGDFFKRYDGIKAFSFENKEKADFLALSFADFNAADSLAAAGSWTKGDDTSYPANIRLWGSKTSFSALKGVFSANLSSLHAGEVQVDFENPLKAERMRVSSTFANNFDKKSGCAANPNASNCVFQEVKIYNPDDLNENGAPNGMHIRVLTDDKNAPTFYIIEGRYKYRAEKAAGFAQHGLGGTREIYFKTVQKSGQVWGQFNFLDENGNDVLPGGLTDLIVAALKAGVCKSTVTGADVASCTEITPANYASLWLNRTGMDGMTTTPITTDFETGKPTKSELCLTAFPNCIDLSGN